MRARLKPKVKYSASQITCSKYESTIDCLVIRNSDFTDKRDALTRTEPNRTARPNPPTNPAVAKYATNKNRNMMFTFLIEAMTICTNPLIFAFN